MHDNGVTLQKKVLQNLDIPYSYELAKRMEQHWGIARRVLRQNLRPERC